MQNLEHKYSRLYPQVLPCRLQGPGARWSLQGARVTSSSPWVQSVVRVTRHTAEPCIPILGEELVLVSAALSPYLAIMQAVADPHQRPPASLLPELHEHGQVALHAVSAVVVPVTQTKWFLNAD